MPGRRPRKDGTLTETSPGVWRLRVYLGVDPQTKHPRQASRTIHTAKRGGKTIALEELKKFIKEIEDKKLGIGQGSTFGYLLDEWLAHLPRQGKAPNTIAGYTSMVKKHIKPGLGHVKLGKLTAHHLDDFYLTLEEESELQPQTIRLIHGVISAALNQGIKWEWLKDSPARNAEPPTVVRKAPHAPTVDEMTRLFAQSILEDPDMAVAIVLAMRTGARRGELCGLQWGDVNWETKMLHIERALVPGKGGQDLRPTKTKRDRYVPMDESLVQFLVIYRTVKGEQFPEVELAPTSWLISPDGGPTPLRAKALTEYITGLGKRLDPPVTTHLHETRHFAISEMIGAGFDPVTVAAIAGHTNPTMTLNVYSSSNDERGRAAIAMLGKLVPLSLATAEGSLRRLGSAAP